MAEMGFQGVSFGARRVVSDVEGLFQVGFGIKATAFFQVVDSLGRLVSGVNIAVSWAGGSDAIVNLDPLITYFRDYPTDTPLTISVAETATFQAQQIVVTIPANGFRRLDVQLIFKEQYARLTKKRYL